MGAVAVLRELWRRRLFVAAGAVLAVVAGLFVAYKISLPFSLQSRSYEVGIASTTALVDTPASQVVDLGDSSDGSAAALPGRAALLASLLSTSPLKDEVAKTAGVDPRRLLAGPAPAAGGSGAAMPTGSTVSYSDPQANILTVTPMEALPMLSVETQAPDAVTAAKLSNGAIAVLQSHLDTLTRTDAVPNARRLVVKQLGAARVAVEKRGPSHVLAVITAMFIFGLSCACIIGVSWLVRSWRQAAMLESMPQEEWPVVPDWHVNAAEQRAPADGVSRLRPVPAPAPAPALGNAPAPPPPAEPARSSGGSWSTR